MAEPIRMKTKPAAKQNESEEISELYKAVLQSKPKFATNEEAAKAAAIALEKLAAEHGYKTVEAMLRDADTTSDSQPHHIEALKLERQLAILSR